MIKIGFLGPKGTFSQEALYKYTNNSKDYIEYDFNNINALFIAVRDRIVDEAIVPIENSLEGAVGATLDMLISEKNIRIKAETIIKVSQNLLVKKGTKIENIKVIASHPQPIGQCNNYINLEFPSASIKYTYSTAEAAIETAKSKGEIASIGSRIAADEYGLYIMKSDIQDVENNMTRFVVVSEKDSNKTGNDKTSLVFSTEDKPGSLYRILDIFNVLDINLTKIESRPSKNKLGEYVFFVDILGNREEDDVKSAIKIVKRKCSFLKILGSFPISDKIEE